MKFFLGQPFLVEMGFKFWIFQILPNKKTFFNIVFYCKFWDEISKTKNQILWFYLFWFFTNFCKSTQKFVKQILRQIGFQKFYANWRVTIYIYVLFELSWITLNDLVCLWFSIIQHSGNVLLDVSFSVLQLGLLCLLPRCSFVLHAVGLILHVMRCSLRWRSFCSWCLLFDALVADALLMCCSMLGGLELDGVLVISGMYIYVDFLICL